MPFNCREIHVRSEYYFVAFDGPFFFSQHTLAGYAYIKAMTKKKRFKNEK